MGEDVQMVLEEVVFLCGQRHLVFIFVNHSDPFDLPDEGMRNLPDRLDVTSQAHNAVPVGNIHIDASIFGREQATVMCNEVAHFF